MNIYIYIPLHCALRFTSEDCQLACSLMLQQATKASMDRDKGIRNSSTNVSFAVYGCSNVEEGNDYKPHLESEESIESASSPKLSDASSFSFSSSSSIESLSDFSELFVQLDIK